MQVGRVSRLEGMTYNAWIGGVSEACSFNLAQQLLTRNDETRLLAVNFDPQVLYHVISRLMCCGMVTGVFHLKLPHKRIIHFLRDSQYTRLRFPCGYQLSRAVRSAARQLLSCPPVS